MAGEPTPQVSLRNRLFDSALELKDAGAVTSSAAAQVDAAARVVDLGHAAVKGDLVLDVSAIDVASGDEIYRIMVEFSSSATFASDITAQQEIVLGDASTIGGGRTVDSGTGRRIVPVTNVVDGAVRRYMRLFHSITGTSPSINYKAYLSQLEPA